MKNATITRAKSAFASDFYNMLTKSCANCDTEFLSSDFVAIDDAKIFCVSCFMISAKISPKDFSKILKSQVGCEICGFSASAFALQYDHTNHAEKYRTKSGKIVEPSDLFRTCSVSVFVAEISKCVIRCANCHAIKTARERGLE
jgi:hypothetical protein